VIENYQKEQALEERETQDASFATIDAVFDDGLTLKFDGQEEASPKHYKCNAFCVFHPGDRVRVIKDAKTYVVEYPVGVPRKTFEADSAAQAEKATHAESAAYAERASDADHAANADSAARLTGTVDYASRAGSASNLYSDGYEDRARIWLAYSGGYYYIVADGGARKRIATS
jgi:hypothetical protein